MDTNNMEQSIFSLEQNPYICAEVHIRQKMKHIVN